MAICSITLGGLDFGCRDGVGGIKRIWIAEWSAAAASVSDDIYSATAASFKLYNIRTGNGSMTSNLTADEANGTTFVQTDLNVKFTKMDEDSRKEIAEILKGNLAVIVEDNKGVCWGLGAEHPVTLTSGSVATGAALSDFNGYDITLTDYASTLPCVVSETIVSSLPQTV